MSRFQFKLFGYPQFIVNGRPFKDFKRRKTVALLIYLAITKRTHTREALADLLWSETSNSMRGLSTTLHEIRSSPLGSLLIVDDELVVLDTAQLDCDVLKFEDAIRRLQNIQCNPARMNVVCFTNLSTIYTEYKAEFLGGFRLDDLNFDMWAMGQMIRYQQQYCDKLNLLADYIFKDKLDSPRLADIGNKLLAIDPLNEHGVEILMRYHAHKQEWHMARGCFDLFMTHHCEEYPNEPIPAHLKKLAHDIQDGRYQFTMRQQQHKGAIKSMLPPVPRFFAGRNAELTRLKTLLLQSQSLASRVFVIVGALGMGKTAFTSMVVNDADVVNHFADGVLYETFSDTDDAAVILRLWLRALRMSLVSGITKKRYLAMQWQFAIFSKHLLLVIDDVQDVKDAQPFLTGESHSAIIFTTRDPQLGRALGVPESQIFHMERLTTAQGVRSLRDAAPTLKTVDTPVLDALVECYQGIPMAMRVMAEALIREDASQQAQILEALADPRHLINETIVVDDPFAQDLPKLGAYYMDWVTQLGITLRDALDASAGKGQGILSPDIVMQLRDVKVLLQAAAMQAR